MDQSTFSQKATIVPPRTTEAIRAFVFALITACAVVLPAAASNDRAPNDW